MSCANDKIAIVICVRPVRVGFQPVAVGVPGQVEPMPAPALVVMRTAKQPLDQLLIRRRSRIGDEFLHFAGRWGEANQIEINSADERAPVGRRIGTKAAGFVRRQNEAVDRRPDRLLALHRGQSHRAQRPIGPVLAVLGCDHQFTAAAHRSSLGFRPARPLVDPLGFRS